MPEGALRLSRGRAWSGEEGRGPGRKGVVRGGRAWSGGGRTNRDASFAQDDAVRGVAKSRTRLSDFTFMHWRRKWQPTPVFLPGKSHGQRRLPGYSP